MIIALRIWWWKWRCTERILEVGFGGDRTSASIKGAKQVTEAVWATTVEWHEGNVEKALADSPINCADEELSCWSE